MRIVTGAVWALFGLMQFQLSAFVFARHAAPGVVFLLAGIGILVGLFWNSTPLFLGGSYVRWPGRSRLGSWVSSPSSGFTISFGWPWSQC